MLRSLALLALGLTKIGYAADVDQELDEGIADTITVNDFQIAAKNALRPRDYAYYRTAALDETSTSIYQT